MNEMVQTDFRDASGNVANKQDGFKSSDRWLEGSADRKRLSYKKKTNKKKRSVNMRSLKVTKFHYLQSPETTIFKESRVVKGDHPLYKQNHHPNRCLLTPLTYKIEKSWLKYKKKSQGLRSRTPIIYKVEKSGLKYKTFSGASPRF